MSYTIPITKNRIRESQISAQTEDDYSDNIVNPYGEVVLAGYSWSLNALRASVINPDSDQYVGGQFSETNQDTNTTIYHYIDMSGYRGLTVTADLTAGTDSITISYQATTQDDGTAPASITNWPDITQYGMTIQTASTTSASYVSTDHTVSLVEGTNYKYIRITATTSNDSGNDADHQIDYKLWY